MKIFKFIIFVILFCVNVKSFSQNHHLQGIWISNKGHLFQYDSNKVEKKIKTYCNTNLKQTYNKLFKKLKFRILQQDTSYISNDTILIVYSSYYSGDCSFKLKILSINDSVLILKPISKLAKIIYGTNKKIEFHKKGYFKNNIDFERIVYKSSCKCIATDAMFCNSCFDYTIELNSDESFVVQKTIYRNGKSEIKNYNGIYSDSIYKKLTNEIHLLDWNNMENYFTQTEFKSTPLYFELQTIEHNYKMKFWHKNASFVLENLIQILDKIYLNED